MKYRALFCDVDDTLVLHGMENVPSPRVVDALRRLDSRGIHVCLATGRPLSAMQKLLSVYSGYSLSVISGGAQIYDPRAEKIIQNIYLPKKYWPGVFEVSRRFGLSVGYFDGETDKPFDGTMPPGRVIGWYFPEVPHGIAAAVMAETEKLTGIAAHRVLSWDKKYAWIDMTSESATKLHGITEVAKRLGMSTHEMVGIGDGYNDFPLLLACGLKIAMGNAVPELKEIADFDAPRVEEDVVANDIEKFFLSE